MAKTSGKCVLCNSNKFLNFAGLCKRCNRLKASAEISENAMKMKQEKTAAKKKRDEQQAMEDQEMEETTQETDGESKDEGTKGHDKRKE